MWQQPQHQPARTRSLCPATTRTAFCWRPVSPHTEVPARAVLNPHPKTLRGGKWCRFKPLCLWSFVMQKKKINFFYNKNFGIQFPPSLAPAQTGREQEMKEWLGHSLPGQPQDSAKIRSFRAASTCAPWLVAGHELWDCSLGWFSGRLRVPGIPAPPPGTVTLARSQPSEFTQWTKALSNLVGNSLHHSILLNKF